MPDWGTILENRADNSNVKMQKLLGRNSRSLELFQEINLFAGFCGDSSNVNRP